MSTSLQDTPPEVFKRILLFAISLTPAGPPGVLFSLHLTCRQFHKRISEIPVLDLLLYSTSFGALPTSRDRHGPPQIDHELEDDISIELRRRFNALKCFRRGRDDDPCLREAFWVALLMIIDNDVKSYKQLQWAGFPALLKSFIRRRLYDGSETNNGWPVETEINCLALALLWYSSSNSKPYVECARKTSTNIFGSIYKRGATRRTSEGYGEHQALCLCWLSRTSLHNHCFVPLANLHQYPLFDNDEYYPKLKGCGVLTSGSSHGPCPPSRPACHTVQYFGKRTAQLRVPPISIFATLCYFSRLETIPHMIPPHLAANRAEADAAHRVGPTREDCEQFINTCRTRFPRNSLIHPDNVGRNGHYLSPPSSPIAELFISQSPGYTLGSMTGRWKGSNIVCSFCHLAMTVNDGCI